MPALRGLAEHHPFPFVIGLALALPLLAMPFVVAFRLAGLDLVGLRLILPAVQSALVLWIIHRLGWRVRAGFTPEVCNVQLYWYRRSSPSRRS